MKIKNIQRIASVAALCALLIIAARNQPFNLTIFGIGLLTAIIPTNALLALTALIATSAVKVFKRSKLARAMLVGLLVCQAVILFSWTEGWTVASAFNTTPLVRGRPVIDPQLESALMMAFWLAAAFVVALMIEHLLSLRLKLRKGFVGEPSFRKQALIVACELGLLLALNSSFVTLRRTEPAKDVKVAASVSADGAREARLVPLNAWIDTNGVILARRPNSIIWRTIGFVGDSLTETESGRFVWSSDGSKVYLLLNLEPIPKLLIGRVAT